MTFERGRNPKFIQRSEGRIELVHGLQVQGQNFHKGRNLEMKILVPVHYLFYLALLISTFSKSTVP